MASLKIALLLVGAYLTDRAITPPNPSANPEKVFDPEEAGALERKFYYLLFHKCLYTIACLCECLVLLARTYPSNIASDYIFQFLVYKSDPLYATSHIIITPMFIFGTILLSSGAILRLVCFRELGRLFTFEFSVLDDHKLITTGPYSIVRHPSYTGMALNLAGILLVHLTRVSGSWMVECGIIKTWFGAAITLWWFVITAGKVDYAIRRSKEEDAVLKKEFPKEWNAWAKNVKYRILPGVL